MINSSLAVRAVMFVFNWILNVYNGSFIEKIYSAVAGFFARQWQNSFLKRIVLKSGDGTAWQSSAAFKAVSFPVRLLSVICAKISSDAEKIKTGSSFVHLLKNFADLPLRFYGALLASLTAGMTAVTLLRGARLVYDAYALVVLAVLSVILLLLKCTLRGMFCGSGVFNLAVQSVLMTEPKPEKPALEVKNLGVICALFFAAGVLGAFFGVIVTVISLVAVLGALTVLCDYRVGVFAAVILFPLLPTMLSAALAVFTFVSFCIYLATEKNAKYVFTPFNMVITVFLVLAFISAVTGYAPQSSLKIFLLYFAYALVYMLIVNTVKTKKSWYALAGSLAAVGALLAFYGLLQNFVLQSTTQSWVDTQMFQDIKTRVYATFDNPNVLGQYFVLMIPFVFAIMCTAERDSSKIVYAVINLIMFACLMYTWSRGAWVGVVLALGFFLFLRDRRWLVLCVIGLLVMPSVLPASVLSRLTSIGNVKDSSTAYRVSVWRASARIAHDYFFTGIGMGSDAFGKVYPTYALNGAGFALHSHNFYIQWVVEMGIAGLAVFAAFIVRAYKQIGKAARNSAVIKAVTLAMAGALLGYMFQAFAENLWYNFKMVLLFFVYLGMLQSAVNISKADADGEIKHV